MTTGTVDPYLKLPEDINAPKPGYFFNVFWMIHSYMNLVLNTPDATSGPGIVKLYSYRMGVLSPDTSVLESTYIDMLEKGQKKIRKTLDEFANSMISYNLITLIKLISNTLVSDISRGFGDDSCLTADTMRSIYQFCNFYKTVRLPNEKRDDNIDSVVETTHYNATYYTPGISSLSEIITLIETIDVIIRGQIGADEYARRTYLLKILRIIYYVGCRYYRINLLRFNDQNIKRPYMRSLGIQDFTLSAIPFDPILIQSCSDEGSSMSRFGIEYIQSLHAVLSELGGVECIINYPALKPENKE